VSAVAEPFTGSDPIFVDDAKRTELDVLRIIIRERETVKQAQPAVIGNQAPLLFTYV
jgi:hypothetical protein